jgi:hypothetical protein
MKRILALTMALFMSLLAVNPSLASGTYTVPLVNDASSANFKIYPLTDFASVEMWTTSDGSGNQVLHSVRLNLDGTVDVNVTDLDATANTRFSPAGYRNYALMPDGTLAVAWATRTRNGDFYTSRVKIAYTKNGVDWSIPIEPVSSTLGMYSDCDDRACGYQWPHLTIDKLGRLVLGAIDVASTSRIVLKTSLDGVIWSSESLIDLGTNHLTNFWDLQALPSGGALAIYSNQASWNTEFLDYHTTRLGSGLNASWSFPTSKVAVKAGYVDVQLVPTGNGKLAWLHHFKGHGDATIEYWVYDEVNDLFSPRTGGQLSELPDSFPNPYNNLIYDQRGDMVAVAMSVAANGAQYSLNRLYVFKNGVAQPEILLPNSSDQNTQIIGVHINADFSVSVAWSGFQTAPKLAKYKDGLQQSIEDIPISMAGGNPNAVFTPSGNLFLVMDYWDVGLQSEVNKSIVYQGASAPTASGPVTISGKAKVGVKLKSALPTFTNQVTGVGVSKVQWYSCASAILAPQNSVPQNCVPIPTATNGSFKVTKKQKNKFLSVSVTNGNAFGSVTLIAKSTSRVK